nr:MAG TPA: hypothetical protein [Caudoviricetes sp.]
MYIVSGFRCVTSLGRRCGDRRCGMLCRIRESRRTARALLPNRGRPRRTS